MTDTATDKLDYRLSSVPDVGRLREEWTQTLVKLGHYRRRCSLSYDDRRCYWVGKSNDLRKHGVDAFPWDGASDVEVPLIAERVNKYVALCMSALKRSNIRAYPVAADDIKRAKLISGFLKFMVHTYIDRFMPEMEANANYFFEKGLMVTYVGWNREQRSFLQTLDLAQIAQMSPELAEAIQSGENDEDLFALMQTQFPALVKKRFNKAMRELRKKGVAELPVSKRQVDAPMVKAVPADGDIFFPPQTHDPQRAPHVFYRVPMTAQEIMQKVTTEGWDKEWAEYVVEHYRGIAGTQLHNGYTAARGSSTDHTDAGDSEFIEVLHVYQRLIDEEDGSEGIYRTTIHPQWTGDENEPKFAKFELQDGLEDYPFVVTSLSEECRNLYDVQTFSDLLRGAQWQVKVERDQRVDAAGLRVLPPIMHPAERPPQEWGPGRFIPYRRPGELHFGPTPPPDNASYNIEQTLIGQADKLIGLDLENPISSIQQQFYVDKFLSHVRDVLKMAFKCYQIYGPDELFFRVTGMAQPEKMVKGEPGEELDINVSFDTQNNDPESMEKKLGQFVQLLSLDRQGKVDVNTLLEVMAGAIDPVLADAIMQPTDAGMEEITRQVTDDLAKIFAGIEVPARPQGAQIATQLIQQYASQPDIAQRAQGDEAFGERLKKYYDQYNFQLQQMQNAEIGKVGTAPANMGGASTQNVNMQ